MKRVLALVLVVAVAASTWWLLGRDNEVEAPLPEGIRTARVTRGRIDALISATGSVAAERAQPLAFAMAGTVSEVLVGEGEAVSEGQVLARLDRSSLLLSLEQAEAALAVQEASLERARKGPSEEEIASARAAVRQASAQLADLRSGPSERDIELAKLAIDQAKNSLWAAQGNRDATVGNPMVTGGAKTQAEAQVLNAELAVKQAEINYERLFDPPSEAALRSAEAQLVQAEARLAQLLSSPSPEDLAVAEAQVEQARVGVKIARQRLEDAELTAPFSGTIASWDIEPGDVVAALSPVGTLLSDGRFYVRLNIDETEIGLTTVGLPAQVVLDAYPEQTLEGVVTRIDTLGSSAQGIVTYGVRVDLEPTGLPVRPLMTAAVDIIVEQKDDVVLVPNRALRRDTEGIYVEVLVDNIPTRAEVTLGATDGENTEVIAGLEEGATIIVSRPRVSPLGAAFGGE